MPVEVVVVIEDAVGAATSTPLKRFPVESVTVPVRVIVVGCTGVEVVAVLPPPPPPPQPAKHKLKAKREADNVTFL